MNKSGFREVRTRELGEINGTLFEMEHEKTGARLAWLKRPDDNKTFGIAFRTIPENDTGVFHILEHSVLCGSDRYPVKEPFVELLKNSMNTFLNAMTFNDKTFYPISSRNDKDFLNLMRVYLDAVFCPRIYSMPEIFYQEGWHYEFDENGKATYKGVVFNEMKGAYASADEHLQSELMKSLFPDNGYRFSSGGDPVHIPELSYEEFLNSHRRFYSPTNSLIFLDGDMDIDTVLSIIDTEYLSRMEKGTRIPVPALQQPVNAGVKHVTYELGAEEPIENRYRVAWGSVLGTFADREDLIALSALSDVLCGSNESPLSRAILEKGLAESITMQVMNGIEQPVLIIDVQNCTKENIPVIEQTVRNEIEKLCNGALSHEELIARLTNQEFKMREGDYGGIPTGLGMGISALSTWLYDGDPAQNLTVGDIFEKLRKDVENGVFETRLKALVLDNSHTCEVILEPSYTLGEERRKAEEERLEAAAAQWNAETKETLVKVCEKLQAWQQSEDTPEMLATLPRLELSDISPDPEKIPTEKTEVNGVPVLKHSIGCSGIVYTTLYFELADLKEEELPVASFMAGLLGDMATKNYTAEQLINQTQLLCGSLQFAVRSFPKENNPLDCERKFCVTFSALEKNLEAAVALVQEILTGTTFAEGAPALDILRQWKNGLMQNFIMSGSQAAIGRINAQTSANGVADEWCNGYEFYRWLKKNEENWNWEELQPSLLKAQQTLFGTSRLTVSVTGEMENAAGIVVDGLKLPEGSVGERVALKPWGVRKEGIVIPADIAFAAKGGSLLDNGGVYDGMMPLASRMIGLGYLWNVVRVQGGAYGTGQVSRNTGLACCYSYRDPNAAASLEKFDGGADFLRAMCQEGGDLTGFVIGAVSDASPLLTPRMKGGLGDQMYWSGTTYEMLQERRRTLLSATPEQLTARADAIEKTIKDGGVCVIGPEGQLTACGLTELLSL